MEFGLEKCAKITFNRGKLTHLWNLVTDTNRVIQELEQGKTYKYLGIEESESIQHQQMIERLKNYYYYYYYYHHHHHQYACYHLYAGYLQLHTQTNHVTTVYSVAAVLCWQSVLHVMLLCILNMFCTFTLALSSSSYYYYYNSLFPRARFQLLSLLAPRFLPGTSLQ